MALKKSEIYSTLLKCCNKLRSNSGLSAESFKNYVLILLFIKYMSDRVKTGEKTIIVIPDKCSFDDIVALKGTKDIGNRINKIIAKIAEANDMQEEIKLTDHDFCDEKLGSKEESSKLISELVSAFQDKGLDFSQNRAADDDLIGDAYEYLMRNFASLANKDKGQFYTPTEVSRLMALLVGIDQDDRMQVSVYDPTCGSGSLLLRVKAAAKHNVSIDGQDIDPANIELSYLNMYLHGCETADIQRGDTLNDPKHKKNGVLNTYDYVVSNPKFSLHNWMNGAKEIDEFGRWNHETGVPPQLYGDYAFLLHCVRSMKAMGKCAIILPNGVLTRGGEEAKIRQWLIEQHLITGIIAFPANTFFGTSIAANVIVLDNCRKSDGILFIDGSQLGYKDADSKTRLREQDIKRIIDVWRKRESVPHFAYLSTYSTEPVKIEVDGKIEEKQMYEIERKGFALNLSLYVTPEDNEVHQSINAHLFGGIPETDVNRLHRYWDACPTLKDELLKSYRPNYLALKTNKEKVSETIEINEGFKKQADAYAKTIGKWCKQTEPLMLAVGKDNDPKELIAKWGQTILDVFKEADTLVDAYDVYDQLLGYYNETMQDDLYMISRDGWLPVLILPTKKNPHYTDLECDLLPVPLAVKLFLNDYKQRLDAEENILADIQTNKQALYDDNDEWFDRSIFYGKFNETNLNTKIERCQYYRLNDEEKKCLHSLLPYLEKSNKKNKEMVAELSKPYQYLFAKSNSITKSVVNKLLKESDLWEYSDPKQLKVWKEYSDILKEEKKQKGGVKGQEKLLYEAIVATYNKLTAEMAKPIIVQKKWLNDITDMVNKEMQLLTHKIAADIITLATRYEHTLTELETAYKEKENDVIQHLQDMGFAIETKLL